MLWWRKKRPEIGAATETRSSFVSLGGRRFLANAPYTLPKDDQEINRLDFQHFMLRSALLGNYAAPISRPRDILDVGTGTGRWAIEMAEYFPDANVIGVDLVEPKVDVEANAGAIHDRRPPNYVFVLGDVLKGLAFPDASFDLTHQRFLVGALPANRWQEVVVELARVTRPGGWIELVEGIPVPGGPAMERLRHWLIEACRQRGINPLIVQQVGSFLRGAGLRNVNEREVRLPVGRYGGRIGVMTETNYYSFVGATRGLILAAGLASPEEFDATLDAARAEIARGRYTWYFYLAFGQRAG